MTSTDNEGVDLDRLADHLGGALTGTPYEAEVAALVAGDPDWAAAYAALAEADLAVRADLAALGPVGPVPDDVVLRLDRVLAEAARPDVTAARPDVTAPWPAPVPLRRRPGRRRVGGLALAGVAAAAVVVGAVAVGNLAGVSGLTGLHGGGRDEAATGGAAPQAAGAPSLRVMVSGTDWSAGTVAEVGGAPGMKPLPPPVSSPVPGFATTSAPAAPPTRGPGVEGNPGADAAGVPPVLAPLYTAAGRDACLRVVLREYGGTVAVLDYARFDGDPSLVVVLDGTESSGTHRIVVVGPRCGEADAVRDERYSTLVR